MIKYKMVLVDVDGDKYVVSEEEKDLVLSKNARPYLFPYALPRTSSDSDTHAMSTWVEGAIREENIIIKYIYVVPVVTELFIGLRCSYGAAKATVILPEGADPMTMSVHDIRECIHLEYS